MCSKYSHAAVRSCHAARHTIRRIHSPWRTPMVRKISLMMLLLSAALLAQGGAPRSGPDVFGQLQWRFVGPMGNRVTTVAGVPGNPLIYYAGAASGGIFKTVDGGIHWQPIFDDQPVASIGSIAVAPSDPNVVWAGTGEPY